MKTHLFWILEVFAWVLILFLISGGIMASKINYRERFNTYQIFLPDVDGLIDGSPVKMMGIQIGYVNQLDIVGEDVYVKFIVTEPNVKIPHGSRATVEFSGLGGSKSLEIYTPKTDKNSTDKLLIPQNPKRIHDSLGLLNDMFDQVIEITYTVSNFMDKIGIIKSEHSCSKKLYNEVEAVKTAENVLDASSDWLDRAQFQRDKFNKKIKNGKNIIKNGFKTKKRGETNEQNGAKNE